MSFDITDFSGLARQQPPRNQEVEKDKEPVEVQPTGSVINKLSQDFNRVPSMSNKERELEARRKQELPGAWSIDKAIEDGQISSGEVDKEQAEFLANTTFVD